jgi:hypothetical protein
MLRKLAEDKLASFCQNHYLHFSFRSNSLKRRIASFRRARASLS